MGLTRRRPQGERAYIDKPQTSGNLVSSMIGSGVLGGDH
jgi:hypothetical protein